MRVRFTKDWFGPGEHLRQPAKPHTAVVPGHLYLKTPKSAQAVDLPDHFRDLLHPSFATIVDADDKPEVLPVPAQAPTLSDFDDERHGQDSAAAIVERAEARVAGTRKPPRS